MNFYKKPSFLTIAGSRAYNLATDSSDLDIVGFVLPPPEIRDNIFQNFDEWANKPEINNDYTHLINPANPKIESKVYSLKKFLKLAAECNPNIIELLWVNEDKILHADEIGREVLDNRNIFLSKQAKFRFLGYAFAQFQKIERHRKWIVKGEIPKPQRPDFGLPDSEPNFMGEVNRLIKQQVELWNFHDFGFDEEQRNELKERIWGLVGSFNKISIDWGNWPEIYEVVAVKNVIDDLKLTEEVQDYINKEVRYKNSLKEYSNWVSWKKNRNPERKVLEDKFGFDLKHAMHLIRLGRVGLELLQTGVIQTTRPDRDELLLIKNGGWSYDKLNEEFQKLNQQIEAAYLTSKLPHSTNKDQINQLYQKLLSYE